MRRVFRIRRLGEIVTDADRRDLTLVLKTLQDRLPGIPKAEIDAIPDRLRDPFGHGFRALLFLAEDLRGTHRGFALILHAPDQRFAYLDYLAVTRARGSSGIGGALYEHVRDAVRELGCIGLFFECLPDDPAACSQPEYARSNAARLRFYERFGARPIVGTDYERPLRPGQRDMPHLVFDDLGSGRPLPSSELKSIVHAILTRKYSGIVDAEYVAAVLDSIHDDPVRLRAPRYTTPARAAAPPAVLTARDCIALVVNDRHQIHHRRERGYVESPVRVAALLGGILPTGLFSQREPQEHPDAAILAVHDEALVEFLRNVCAQIPPDRAIYPYVFPLRNHARPPRDLAYCAGYYCIDTFTPLTANAWLAARRAVDCTLTAAGVLQRGERQLAYALVRPPGHHAERRVFGGFCYFNNAAIAAQQFARDGKVAILDIDYHHGNGQQEIFWERGDVLTVSIHGEPAIAYPFFSGFAEERGGGAGAGANLNLPLPEQLAPGAYAAALQEALQRITEFAPRMLVVAAGFDTAAKDPTGTWSLRFQDFFENGRSIGRLRLPTLVVQEGGYRSVSLGENARAFFEGLAAGSH